MSSESQSGRLRQVLIDLEFISQFQPNSKPNFASRTLSQNTFYGGVQRFLKGESYLNVTSSIRTIVETAISEIPHAGGFLDLLLEKMYRARGGIENLIVSYSVPYYRAEVVPQLKAVLDTINHNLIMNKISVDQYMEVRQIRSDPLPTSVSLPEIPISAIMTSPLPPTFRETASL